MITKDLVKKKVCETIDNQAQRIIEIGEDIFCHPELGFKEERTSNLVASCLTSLGLETQRGLALTGVKATANGRKKGPHVMIMGELDAVVCPLHPHSDPVTGASHSCGHNAQIASMIGSAMGLLPILNELDGSLSFCGVPAEEYVELAFRKQLKDQGKIEFYGGKQEWIRQGFFDDIDMGMMCHSHAGESRRKFLIDCDSSGFIGRTAQFRGKEAHAGAEPYHGVNALNAASLAIVAMNMQRETFKDSERVRVHPIITKGGDLVNIVPSDVRMEMYIRARNIQAVTESAAKIERAIKGSSMAIGTDVTLVDIPGYLPLRQDPLLCNLSAHNAKSLLGKDGAIFGEELKGATDAGDVSSIMPFNHLSSGGFTGVAHSLNFTISDKEMAYVLPAKLMALNAVDLLWDGATEAKKVIKDYTPSFASNEEYCQFWRGFSREY